MARVSLRRSGTLMMFLALGACSAKKADTPTAPATAPAAPDAAAAPLLPEAERLVLDSANNFFRAKSYTAALDAYRRAAAAAPLDVAPWFGVYMVATATKDTKLGDVAIAEMRSRGGSVPGQATDSALKAAHRGTAISPTAH